MNEDHHPVGRPLGERGAAKVVYAELRQRAESATNHDWELVAGNEHHGPYVTSLTGDICDLYTMSNPMAASIRNGGDSYPVLFQGEESAANAAYIVAAQPQVVLALLDRIEELEGAVSDIAEATDPDNAESYRCDDREGCLDTVHAIARKALSGEKP